MGNSTMNSILIDQRYIRRIYFCLMALLLVGCANKPPVAPRAASDIPLVSPVKTQEPFIRQNMTELKKQSSQPETLKTPDYQPVSDDVSPAKTRLVNIQARNTALGDVLHVIAEAAGLNLIIADGVQQDRQITITLKRVTADDALATILQSVDYFYTIKDNILTVEATGTKVFELGHPALVQGYSVDVGGDILGSAAGLTASGSGSGSSSSSSSSSGSAGSASSNIKGTVTQSTKHDSKAFDFWESLEKSLSSMLNKRDTSTTILAGGALQPPPSPQQQPRPNTNEPQQNVIINRLTGTIMVTATRRNLVTIEKYLDLIKAALNRQVLVEARVIEVQLDDNLKFGIDWDFLNNIKWFNTTGALSGGFGNLVSTAANAVTEKQFRLGYSGTNVQALLTALKTQGEVKTLSNPRIHVMNGQTALLTVGRNTNFVSKVTSTTTATSGTPITTYTVDTSNVLSGIMIGLAPHINSKGEISMAVTPIISDLVSLTPTNIGSGSNQTTIQIPIVDLRELSTTVKVRNGEMIVIGGLISNKNQLQDEKVPFIGDIPWLGTLFSRKDYTDKRSELVVILQPYLIGND